MRHLIFLVASLGLSCSAMAATTQPSADATRIRQLEEQVSQLQSEVRSLEAALVQAGVISMQPVDRPHDYSGVLTPGEREMTRSTTRPSVLSPPATVFHRP